MGNYTRNLRHNGLLPAEAAQAIGELGDVIAQVDVDATADVGGGGTTAVTGFQLVDQAGNKIERAVPVGFGVYDDADGVTPATNATLNTATVGSILAGAGTAELTVKTSATGKFTCTLTNAVDETVYLMGKQALVGGLPQDNSDRESVAFSA
jgi:hypothetical protein